VFGTDPVGKRARGISFPAFERHLPDEASCKAFLFWLRNGHALPCPRCGRQTSWNSLPNTMTYRSRCCGARVSVTRDTIMVQTHMSLWTWLYTFILLLNMSGFPSAHVLARHLGVSSQCAFNMLTKIRRQVGVACQQGIRSLERRAVFVHHCYIRNVKTSGYRGTGKLSVLIMSDGQNVFGVTMKKRGHSEYRRIIRRTGCGQVHTNSIRIFGQLSHISSIDAQLMQVATTHYPPQVREAHNLASSFAVYLQRSMRIIRVPVARDKAQLYIDEFVFRFNFASDKAMLYPLFLSSFTRL
jgi:hypothetical protein